MRTSRILLTETRKFLSLKLWWLALTLTPTVAVLATALLLFAVSATSRSPLDLTSSDNVLAATNLLGSLGYVVPLSVGVLIYTSDVAHRTLALTLVGEPSRTRIYLIKIVVAAIYGAVIGAATAAGGLLGGLIGLALTTGTQPALAGVAGQEFLIVVTFAIWATLGVGLGALVRSSLFAVVGVLAITQLVEPMVRLAVSAQVAEWTVPLFPGTANDASIGGSLVTLASGGATATVGSGLAVLLSYAAVLLVSGGVRSAHYELR